MNRLSWCLFYQNQKQRRNGNGKNINRNRRNTGVGGARAGKKIQKFASADAGHISDGVPKMAADQGGQALWRPMIGNI